MGALTARERVFIYTLADPVTGDIRYVGKTFDLKQRLRGHLTCKHPSYSRNWIKSLRERGLRPVIEILEELNDCTVEQWEEAERFWISSLRYLGFQLVNLQSGGVSGKRLAAETKEKLRIAHLGKKCTPEHRAKVSAAGMGRVFSAETRAKISAKHLGRKHTPEHVEKIASLKRGTSHSLSTRLKMSQARIGKPRLKEHINKVAAANRGKKRSAEQIERIRQGALRGHETRRLRGLNV